jgi:carboxyl-terminal processing protease
MGTFNVHHFYWLDNSEKASAEVAQLFIENLDESGYFLLAGDVNKLREAGTSLLEDLSAGKEDYVNLASAIYLNALKRTDSVLSALSKKTLNFSENDTAYFFPYNSNAQYKYSADISRHAKRIEKYVKVRCYERALNTEENERLNEKEFNTKAGGFSKTVTGNFQALVRDLIDLAVATTGATLLNAIALRYDPHSNYFTREQNKEFSKALSSRVETFGFYVDEDDDGNIIISHIEPGGSAWLSNQVNEGDFLQSLKAGNTRLAAGVNSLAEIEALLESTEEKNVLLTVKKANGQVKAVKLLRQKIASEDNSVKGYLLQNGALKVGYISLPSFYTDMENMTLPGCANDVAKEILKLEKDSISGLIIDLRNNGGGSMLEAMNLAGIFIDEGPLFIYRERNKKPTLVKDINRGSIFRKPIVVMINESSASASELFSNIVKDYNLGLVVGQTSYGKGTAQTVWPLDTSLLNNKRMAELNRDYIKITHAKFYRLNGSTHQGTGVVPDIFLPKLPSYAYFKESKEKFFIKPDSIVKKVIFNPNPPVNVAAFRKKSEQRINASPEFKRFTQSADSLTRFLNASEKVPLKFSEYTRHKAYSEKLFSAFENACKVEAPRFKCANNTFDEKLSSYNAMVKEFNVRIIQTIENDIQINETFSILTDLITP